jgi:flagellar biosynthesis protein FlhG
MKKSIKNKPEIWAIGSGKGGTGKSFLVSQLAICLALTGKKVILIDTDFGGANLHFFLGIKHPKRTLIDYFEQKELLENLIYETKTKNLGIIIGNYNSPFISGLKINQKVKFYKDIKKVAVDYILLDLATGTTADTIDIFIGADKKIAVTIPEIIAIENLIHFLKNAFLKKINNTFSSYGIQEISHNLWTRRQDYGIKNITDLIEHVNDTTGRLSESTIKELSNFSIYLVLNMIRNPNEILEGFSVKSICKKYLGINTLFSGYLEYDNQFWKNVSLMPSKKFNVSPRIEQEVALISQNINSGNQIKIDRIKNV